MSVNRGSGWEHSSTVLAVAAGTAAGRQQACNCYEGGLLQNRTHQIESFFDIREYLWPCHFINQYNLDRKFYLTRCCIRIWLYVKFSVSMDSFLIAHQSELRDNLIKVVAWIYVVG